jgi:hypothetical protein
MPATRKGTMVLALAIAFNNEVALDLGLSEREVKDSYELVQAFVKKHCPEYLK